MNKKTNKAFSGKLLCIGDLKLNNSVEIYINEYHQGIVTIYRVSREIVTMAQEKLKYLVMELENGEKITALGLNFESTTGKSGYEFELKLQADILLIGKNAYTDTFEFQEIHFEITEGNELIGLCPYDINKNYADILFCRKIDVPIHVENKNVQLENGELMFSVHPKYQYSKESFSIGFEHCITWKFESAIDMEQIRKIYI